MIPIGNILSYLTNSGTIADDISVHDWLESNHDNLRELNKYEDIWSNTDQLKNFKVFDLDSEWQSFVSANDIKSDSSDSVSKNDAVQTESAATPVLAPKKEAKVIQLDIKKSFNKDVNTPDFLTPQPTASKKKSYMLPLSIAASFLLLLGSYFIFSTGQDVSVEPQLVYNNIITGDSPQVVTLEDGTIITLQENSQLTYPESFAGLTERSIKLDGAGTFEVVKNPEKPLVVEAGITEIKVLGTTFVIEISQDKEEKVEVENIEGLIKFYEAGNEENGHLLTEGQKMLHSAGGFTDTTEEEIIPSKPKGHTISHILNHLNLISDGKVHSSSKLKYDKQQRFEVNLDQDVHSILLDLYLEAQVDYIRKDCEVCYEITKFEANK